MRRGTKGRRVQEGSSITVVDDIFEEDPNGEGLEEEDSVDVVDDYEDSFEGKLDGNYEDDDDEWMELEMSFLRHIECPKLILIFWIWTEN